MLMIGVKTAAAAAAVGLATMVGAPAAAAEQTNTNWLGTQIQVGDGNAWTVSHLGPSTDAIPYPVQGTLYEATASDTAGPAGAVPIIGNFNARAKDGTTYRVLWEVATPQGVSPATLAGGAVSTGKIYFDVNPAAPPDSVVYRGAGGPDLALWLTPPPSASASSSAGASSATPGQAASEVPTAAGDEALPEAQSFGTPIAPGAPAAAGAGIPETGQVLPEPQSLGTPVGEVGAQTPAAPAESPVTGTAPAGEAAPVAQPTSEGTPAPPTGAGAPEANVVPLIPITPAQAAG
ncbi:MAG: DUF1942 domain-containing protein [Actinomycetia bacterium]|nr:DUF1942 domain-containing protein [Actinomycetes bacterium]